MRDPLNFGIPDFLVEIAERLNADYIFGKTVPYGPEPLPLEKLLRLD